MLLLFLIFIPLLAGVFMTATYRKSNVAESSKMALGFSLVVFAYAVYLIFFSSNTKEINLSWVPALGIGLHFALDGISALMFLLTTFLTPLIILSTFDRDHKNPGAFYGLILIMETGLLGVFSAMDGFLFYVFWELALIPIYFIAALWGGERRIQITFKFFIYTVVGSLFMLIAIIYLGLKAGSFDIKGMYAAGNALSATIQGCLFFCFFLAFAIKMPVFPFHTWQPDTYTESPTAATMLLSGIMLKMGIYGVIRWLLPMLPLGVKEWGGAAIILSVIGIIYASLIAIVQKDVKRMVAYSSIAHVGLISAGVFTLSNEGMQGAIVQMLAHGINVVGMFFVIDIIIDRTKTRTIAELGGIAHKAPVFAILAMIILLGTVALPLTNGFIGEFLLLMGLYSFGPWTTAFAGTTIILGAIYMLNMYKNVWFGETNSNTEKFEDLKTSEKMVLIPIVALILTMGIYPKPILEMAQPAIETILNTAIIK